MALTDEEKLSICQSALKAKIMAQETFADFLTLVENFTPAGVRTFLVNKIREKVATERQHATESNDSADDKDALANDIEAIV